MSLFNQRRNKSFSYTPRHKKDHEETPKEDLTSQWEGIRDASKRKKNIFTTLPYMVLFLIVVLVLLYILDRY